MTDPICVNCGKSVLECQGFCLTAKVENQDFECDSQSFLKFLYQPIEHREFPPVGKERNKLIAEIKGQLGYACERHKWAGSMPICSKCGVDYFQQRMKHYWSNNDADAWHLWDELWESHEALNYLQYTGMTGKECHELVAEIKAGEKVHMAYGESFADVVSQVWLLWKGGR